MSNVFVPEHYGAIERLEDMRERSGTLWPVEEWALKDLLRRENLLHDIYNFLSDWVSPNTAQNEGDMLELLAQIEDCVHNRPIGDKNENRRKEKES